MIEILSVIILLLLFFLWKYIKEIKKAKKEIEDLNRQLEFRADKALEDIKAKENMIFHKSRLAQMGEMLSMIAHQWRQPLTAISVTASNLTFKILMNDIDKKLFEEELGLITKYSHHLSTTIDDFKEFFRMDKLKEETTLEDMVDEVMGIIKLSMKNKNIKLIFDYNCFEKMETYKNEFKHVLLNVFKNAEDVLKEQNIQNAKVEIKTFVENGKKVIEIKDNGGGIKVEPIEKVFDSYFSTKSKKNGTGLGLYMSKTIIEDHCDGVLTAFNTSEGAVFRIEMA